MEYWERAVERDVSIFCMSGLVRLERRDWIVSSERTVSVMVVEVGLGKLKPA